MIFNIYHGGRLLSMLKTTVRVFMKGRALEVFSRSPEIIHYFIWWSSHVFYHWTHEMLSVHIFDWGKDPRIYNRGRREIRICMVPISFQPFRGDFKEIMRCFPLLKRIKVMKSTMLIDSEIPGTFHLPPIMWKSRNGTDPDAFTVHNTHNMILFILERLRCCFIYWKK